MVEEGEIYLLDPDDRLEHFNWCRHNIFVVQKDGILKDTYWDSGCDGAYYRSIPDMEKDGKVTKLPFKYGDLKSVDYEDFRDYPTKDRLAIPVGGGHEKWLVLKTSEKDPFKVFYNLYYKMKEKESEIAYARDQVRRWGQELADMNLDHCEFFDFIRGECLATGEEKCNIPFKTECREGCFGKRKVWLEE